MIRLSTSDRFGALPTPWRSSGTWATPRSIVVADRPVGDVLAADEDSPAAGAETGDDLCQLALAVARHRGDAHDLAGPDLEARRHAGRAIPGRRSPRRPRPRGRCRPRASRSGRRLSRIGRPTISVASWACVTPAAGRAAAVTRPRRMTVIRSAIARTSPSLWLMNTMLRPAAVIDRRVRNRSSTSCGASTAVGSSMIRTRAPRYRTLRISTRWRSPTDSCQIRARGSTRRPWASARRPISAS